MKDAPKIDTDGHLSPQEEQELYRYYGMGDGTDTGIDTDTTRPRRRPTTRTDTDRTTDWTPAAPSATTPPARPRTTP